MDNLTLTDRQAVMHLMGCIIEHPPTYECLLDTPLGRNVIRQCGEELLKAAKAPPPDEKFRIGSSYVAEGSDIYIHILAECDTIMHGHVFLAEECHGAIVIRKAAEFDQYEAISYDRFKKEANG